MKLLEHEGKALLAHHGVPIPKGALWPQVPEIDAGIVVKAQVLTGGRGKAGGIKIVEDRSELAAVVDTIAAMTIKDEPVHAVYLEEKIEAHSEAYLAALVDRDGGFVRVVASARGGVDIEQVPAEEIFSERLDAFVGLRDYHVRNFANRMAVASEHREAFGAVVRQVVETLIAEDAELVEINPLIFVDGGGVIAADAKVVLDDDAVFRHPQRATPVAWTTDSSFMQHCRELGVIGVDNRAAIADRSEPNVSVLSNGAGSTMATYDQVYLSDLPVAGAIELHGALARGIDHTANVFSALFELEADIVFINAFYQLRSCDDLAVALKMALDRPGAPARDRLVVRMRGVDEGQARAIVEGAGCYYTGSLRDATERVLQLAAAGDQKAE